jgi:hypothetical protein
MSSWQRSAWVNRSFLVGSNYSAQPQMPRRTRARSSLAVRPFSRLTARLPGPKLCLSPQPHRVRHELRPPALATPARPPGSGRPPSRRIAPSLHPRCLGSFPYTTTSPCCFDPAGRRDFGTHRSDRWSTSRIVPAQPPSGMSAKSGSVVAGFTRTCAPTANLAGKVGLGFHRLGLFFFLDMIGIPDKTLPGQRNLFLREGGESVSRRRDCQPQRGREPGSRRGAVPKCGYAAVA